MLQDQTPGLAERLADGRPISAYNGFDPTASSLHVGSLVPVFGLLHLQRHGGRPVVVVGGGTGMIGDPSGRSSERNLLDAATIESNVAGIRAQLAQFLDFTAGPTGALLVDNHEWLGAIKLLDFLRDVGKHFTVPYMLAKDSVQVRLDAGLSFTEFSYMLLQAADFLHLYRELGVELQTGGADQWGNITAGLELIRRVEGTAAGAAADGAAGGVDQSKGAAPAHGLSFPLLTNASGQKFGKSEGANVWLDPARTSPFAFYQYWVDSSDQDVGRLLRTFTLFDQPSIEGLEARHAAHPEARLAQRGLAWDLTARVHGAAEAERQATVAAALFGGEGLRDPATLELLWSALDSFEVNRADLTTALALAILSGVYASNGEGRRAIAQGGLTINDRRITDPAEAVPALIDGRFLVVRAGKKKIRIGRVAG
jgi:tyrosyl-tRNA synthetase